MMIMAQHHHHQQQQQTDGVSGCSTSHQQHDANGPLIGAGNKQQNDPATKRNNTKTTSTLTNSIHIANTNTDSTKLRQHSPTTNDHQQVHRILDTPVGARDDQASGNNLQQPSSLQSKDCCQQNLQEGKRTLIKNQLYLIEQLQLENANLRNERDQLQLENEELKFQLQMISSSNILSQPGATFSERQLEKLVEASDERDEGETKLSPTIEPPETRPPATGTEFSAAEPTTHSRPSSNKASHLISTAFSSKTSNYMPNRPDRNVASSNSILSKINATPSRRPMRLISNDSCTSNACSQNILSTNYLDNNQQIVRLTALDEQTTPSNIFHSKQTGANHHSHAPCVVSLAANSATHSDNNIIFAHHKSNPLAAFDIKPSNLAESSLKTATKTTSPFNDLCSIAAGQDEDEQLKAELVERRYGDGDQVQAAAITIQRAFRKYQICKRFRAITEQLRHTCQSSGGQQEQPGGTLLVRAKPDRDLANSKQQQLQLDSKNPCEPSSSPIPYTSGTTKVAAWESLSYAASRLAASAAAATATTKQALVNGVTKSASSQQVASTTPTTTSTTATLPTNNNNNNNIQPRSASTTQPPSSDNNQRSNLKSDSVVAAAINFQQLESIRKRQYRVGLNIFNKNPEKGVSFLIAHSFIDMSPPYSKNSQSYYLSNQLHFIDNNKQQHLSAAATNGHSQQISISSSPSTTNNNQQQNCHLCYEEENLKRNVAHFLLHRKGLARERIGQYLGNLQASFNQDVLRYYLQELDFHALQVDIALRKFLSTLRLPGEAQKIERFVDYFAQRYVQCQQQQRQQSSNNNLISLNNIPQVNQLKEHNLNQKHQQQQQQQHRSAPSTPIPDRPSRASKQSLQNQSNYKNNLTLLSKDEIFILTFAIIMLNTDLHSPSLKPTSRMSASQFVHNLRGVFKSQTITESDLIEIYERVKANQITTTPDHVSHVMKVQQGLTLTNFQRKELPNLCVAHRRLVCFCRLFEVYDVNKKERVGQHQREIFLFNDLLLVTKLARRARANATQQYAYRQSISLQGLYVQLFQTTHYNFGIRLCRKGSDETLIMFNARNELDQSRFVDDLTESIAEMDEMESIRVHKTVDAIHFKQQERLRRHALLHNTSENINPPSKEQVSNGINEKLSQNPVKDTYTDNDRSSDNRFIVIKEDNHEPKEDLSHDSNDVPGQRLQSKFSSMSNLVSVVETKDDEIKIDLTAGGADGLRPNRSFVQQQVDQSQRLQDPRHRPDQQRRDPNNSGTHRSCSSGSVHSLDSGLFLSRDVSPNQSG